MSQKEPGMEREVLEAINDAWNKYPDLRFTQLLINAINPSETCSEIYNLEDSKLVKLLNDFKNKT